MVKCEICGKNFKTFSGLAIHLKKEKITAKEYYDEYLNGIKYCYCGKDSKFKNLEYGYLQYCSVTCMNKSTEHKEKIKQSNIKKYGVSCIFQLVETQNKIKDTILERYGVTHQSQSSSFKEKFKKTCLENYGVDSPLKSSLVIEKIKKTNLEKYGCENVFQNEQIKEKSKQTMLDKYNVENASKCPILQEKKKQTFIDRYGVNQPFQNSDIWNKVKKTFLEKYGVDNISKLEEIKEQKRQSQRKTFYNLLITSDRLKSKCTPNFINYTGKNTMYSWTCTTCNTIFESNIDDGCIPRCPICYPVSPTGTSLIEKEITDFCKLYFDNIIENDRTLLNGKEIDIYIPEINLGIEFDGLYWHSEIGCKIGKDYHNYKLNTLLEKNISLIHIFEDEWYSKQNIVKSILLSKMGKIENKIFARKCTIEIIANDIARKFYFENHMQDYINGIHIGLINNGNLVSLLTMGKPRFNKKYEWEIYRFCNVLNTTVVGGLSKLLNYFDKNYNPANILTYVDRRYGIGVGYLKCGFDLIDTTQPNYYYMKNYTNRISRLQFQKHMLESKLEIFDSNLTEWENMQLNGYDRIWDCGNYVYEWNKQISISI